jgi:hypothetical protein
MTPTFSPIGLLVAYEIAGDRPEEAAELVAGVDCPPTPPASQGSLGISTRSDAANPIAALARAGGQG